MDWDGKVALIQCAKALGIQRYVFFSIHNCDKHPEVPLMEIKRCTEAYLADSGLDYTVLRLCGFMQVGVWGNDVGATGSDAFAFVCDFHITYPQ